MKQRFNGRLHEPRLVENHARHQFRRHVRQLRYRILDAVHHRDGIGIAALLQHWRIHRALPVHPHDVGLDLLRVFGDAYIIHPHGRLPHHLERERVDRGDIGNLAIGVDAVVVGPYAHVARREDQVRVVHRPHHVHQAEPVRLQLVGIGVDHDLPVAPAEGWRHRGARHAGNLVAHVELRQVAQFRLIESPPVHGHQADRQAGGVELQHHGRQRSRRQAPQLRHGQVRDGSHGRIGIGAGLEVHLDHAYARQRARFDMLDPAPQREEALEAARDVGFNLLGRHARVERCHRHHRDVHGGKHVHRHAHQADSPYHRNRQTGHQDEVRVVNGKARH